MLARPLGFVIAAALCAAAPVEAQTDLRTWAIRGATLIDGTGAPAIEDSIVVGRGQRITCAGAAQDCPAIDVATEIDAAGKWVIPGLIDTHIHLDWSKADARRAQSIRFAFGTTTVREAGTRRSFQGHLHYRRQSHWPELPEPRLVVSGVVGDGYDEDSNGQDVGDRVRQIAAAGADAVKVKVHFTAEEWRTAVAEADKAGLPVWGHTWSPLGSQLDAAVTAGIDGLAHVMTFSEFVDPAAPAAAPDSIEFWVAIKEKWTALDSGRLRAISDAVIRQGVWFEPLLVTEKYFTLPDRRRAPAGFDFATVVALARPWVPYGASSRWALRARRERIARGYDQMCAFVKDFHARGGMVIAGTDEEPAGEALIEEIGLLSECGLTPLAALQAATRDAAVALRRADVGTIEAGKLADLVILDADPLRNPANLRRVWRVMKGGHAHDPSVLRLPAVSEHGEHWWSATNIPLLAASALLALGALAARSKR